MHRLSNVQRTLVAMLSILSTSAITWCLVLASQGEIAEAEWFARQAGGVVVVFALLSLLFKW